MTTQARVEHHTDTARDFVAKARAHLAADDLLQASKNGWDAASLMVEAVAEERGWSHEGQRQLWQVLERLVDETGDKDIRREFGLADVLRVNFYDDFLPREFVEDFLDRIARLVEKLDKLQVPASATHI